MCFIEALNTADVLSTTFEELRARMAERRVEKIIPILCRGARPVGKILTAVDSGRLPIRKPANAMNLKKSEKSLPGAGKIIEQSE